MRPESPHELVQLVMLSFAGVMLNSNGLAREVATPSWYDDGRLTQPQRILLYNMYVRDSTPAAARNAH